MNKFPACFDQNIGIFLGNIPIFNFLLYPSHTLLFRSYSATSREGCERRRLCQINLNTETPRYRVFLFRFNKFSQCLRAFVFHFLYFDTPSLQTTSHTFRFVLESHELTDIQVDIEFMKDHFWNLSKMKSLFIYWPQSNKSF